MSLSILMHWVQKFWLWGRFVAEKQTYVLNLMAGHLLNMTYNENGKWNVWELDHYTDRSSLGIHFWDLYWKMAYLKFERFWYSNVRPWETVQIWGDCPIWYLINIIHNINIHAVHNEYYVKIQHGALLRKELLTELTIVLSVAIRYTQLL